jgi:hypothetical protein
VTKRKLPLVHDPLVVAIPDVIGDAIENDPDFPGKNAKRLASTIAAAEAKMHDIGPLDTDVTEMSRHELVETVLRYRAAIRADRDAEGHDLCWYRKELWDLMPEKITPEPTVPSEEDFIAACRLYRKSLG